MTEDTSKGRGLRQDETGTYEVLELPTCLLDNAFLSVKDNTHATKVTDLGPAHHQRVDVESPAC